MNLDPKRQKRLKKSKYINFAIKFDFFDILIVTKVIFFNLLINFFLTFNRLLDQKEMEFNQFGQI